MPPNAPDKLVRRVFALINKTRVKDRGDRLLLLGWVVSRPVESTNEMSEFELQCVVDTLSYWEQLGEIESRARTLIATGSIGHQTVPAWWPQSAAGESPAP